MSDDSDTEKLRAELERSRALNKNLADRLEEEKKKKVSTYNLDFVQLYRKEMKQLRRLGQIDNLALQLLLLFSEKMNRQNAIMMSQTTLMQITGKGRTRVNSAIRVLKEENFVKTIKVGSANAYLINSEVFWRASAKLKSKVAIFSATVFATSKEQDQEYLENWDNIELKHMPFLNPRELGLDEEGKVEEIGASDYSDLGIEKDDEFGLTQEQDGEP